MCHQAGLLLQVGPPRHLLAVFLTCFCLFYVIFHFLRHLLTRCHSVATVTGTFLVRQFDALSEVPQWQVHYCWFSAFDAFMWCSFRFVNSTAFTLTCVDGVESGKWLVSCIANSAAYAVSKAFWSFSVFGFPGGVLCAVFSRRPIMNRSLRFRSSAVPKTRWSVILQRSARNSEIFTPLFCTLVWPRWPSWTSEASGLKQLNNFFKRLLTGFRGHHQTV